MRTSVLTEIPAFLAAKRLLSEGKLGAIRHAAVNWETKSGAPASTLALQVFHYLEWLLGPADAVNARFPNTAGKDTLIMMRLRFKPGFYSNLTLATRALHGSGHRLEIYGGKGSLRVDGNALYFNGRKMSLSSRKDAGMPFERSLSGGERAKSLMAVAAQSDALAGKAVFF